MNTHKVHIEEVTRELLEKKYGAEYSLSNLTKSEAPDYIGTKKDGLSFGLEICEVTFTPLTSLMSKSPKIKNVKNLSEIKKGADKIVPLVYVSYNNGVFEPKAFTYNGDEPNAGKEIIENAIKTMESHLKKLQKYVERNIYELAVVLPVCVVGDYFNNYCKAIINSLPSIKNENYKSFFNVLHFIGGNENNIITLTARNNN